MKRIIKGFIPIIIGLICGSVSGRIVYRIYDSKIEEEFSSAKLYLIENGKYETYDEMRFNNSDSYMYYKDGNEYKTVVGITNDKENANKIKELYNGSIIVDDYYVSKELINDKQEEMEDRLRKTKDEKETKEVMKEILETYKDNETMKLVLVK